MGEDKRTNNEGPVLHVIVVGFHHKKGCLVEYSYPALVGESDGDADGSGTDCPPPWKYLPTLALPDGSHNYDKDTVFFHLPGLKNPCETVFGISCFRQIPVEKLKNRTSDITRGTVQKAVCVLSSVPLYGHIQVKMELITHAYFDEGDFTKVSLLEDTYHHLNGCMEQIRDLHQAPQLFVGLSGRELILRLRHKVLVLYKLLLLEKKMLFFQSPVEPLCSTILSLLSLHPGMIEKGLFQSACIRATMPPVDVARNEEQQIEENHLPVDMMLDDDDNGNIARDRLAEPVWGNGTDGTTPVPPTPDPSSELNGNTHDRHTTSRDLCNGGLSRDTSSVDIPNELSLQNTLAAIAQVDAANSGLPLSLFSNGYLCLPYLSLPYMDVLTDSNIRGYIVGATNVLFKQKKNLADVIVELESGLIESSDLEIRRAGHLSTEDLRFGEYLVRHVSEMKGDYLDGVGWEGGDDWVRSQFHAYTLSLLRTSLLPEGSKELDQFNKWYIAALQNSMSYKAWLMNPLSQNIQEVSPGHPFAGHLSVADMKLRLAQEMNGGTFLLTWEATAKIHQVEDVLILCYSTMQTTEGGRKLNQAMVSTGRAVATTGKAVGGAISQAKGAFSNWWSNLTTVGGPGGEPPLEVADEMTEPAQPQLV